MEERDKGERIAKLETRVENIISNQEDTNRQLNNIFNKLDEFYNKLDKRLNSSMVEMNEKYNHLEEKNQEIERNFKKLNFIFIIAKHPRFFLVLLISFLSGITVFSNRELMDILLKLI